MRSRQILREYVASVVSELKRDEKFISQLKVFASGVPNLIEEWIAAVEKSLGEKLSTDKRALIKRFVDNNWPVVLKRTANDVRKAKKLLVFFMNAKLLPYLS